MGFPKRKLKFSVGMKIFIPFIIVTFLVIIIISYFSINKISEKVLQLEQRRANTILNTTMDRLQEDSKGMEKYIELIADSTDTEKALLENDKTRMYEILTPAKYFSGEQKVLVYNRDKEVVASLYSAQNEEIVKEGKILDKALLGITTSGLEIFEDGLYIYVGTPIHYGLSQYYVDKLPAGAMIVYRRIDEKELEQIKAKEGVDINIFYKGKLVDSTIANEIQPYYLQNIIDSMVRGDKNNIATVNKAKYINNWENLGEGTISVMQSDKELNNVRRDLTRDIITTTVFSGLLVLLSSFILTRIILRPLKEMLATTEAITDGDFTKEIKIYTEDEFGQLGRAINFMANKVKERLEYAEHLATVDGLTGMYNHRYFQQRLQEEFKRAEEDKCYIALIMIDIDYFKYYNDNQGHPAGDKVLQEISNIINDIKRTNDIAARYGGEEFTLILPDTASEEALEIGEKIRHAVENHPFPGREEQPNGKVTVSLGISSYPENATSKDELIKFADDALYKAKYISKNKTVLYYSVFDELKSEIDKSEHDLVNTIKTLISVINSKDRYTFGHSERVAQYAVLIAEALGMSDDEIKTIRIGAYLHDIGKIEIERELLNKEGPLNETEFDIIKQHPVWGVQIISSIKSMKRYVPAILYHHERYDGKGYPAGLKGTNIPLEARILKVADCFDAMTTDRPYKAKKTLEEACDELIRCTNTDFDPQIAKIFIDLISNEKQSILTQRR